MSALGKLLAVLNIIAAAAFSYIAMMDYTRHNNWSFGIASLDRKVGGEPVDKSEKDLEGNIKAEDMDAYTLKTLPVLNGKPLVEQEAEVKDLESQLRRKIDSDQPLEIAGLDKKLTTKEQKLAWALRAMAETFARRNALLHVMTGAELTTLDAQGIFEKTYKEDVDPQVKAAEKAALQNKDKPTYKADLDKELSKIYAAATPARLEKDFDDAFKKIYKFNEKEVQEKRKAIGRLLFCTCELRKEDDKPVPKNVFDSKAFPRVQSIIGMETTATQIDNQTRVLERMASQCDEYTTIERSLFVEAHYAALQRILHRKSELVELTRRVEAKAGDVKLQDAQVQEQERVVARVTAELAALVVATQASFETKIAMEKDLLEQQITLRDNVAQIQRLAQELRGLEEQFPRREAQPR
jgi:hypothetical protein